MKIIKTNLVPKGFRAITIGPFILCKSDLSDRVINHETIHWKQELEMLIIPFYIWYVIEYIIKLFLYSDSHKAYKKISFEQEANYGESNLAYPRIRKHYAWKTW